MTEDKKHQLDEITVTDIVSYLGTRLSSMEEHIRRRDKYIEKLEKENAELKSISDFQTSSNMDRYFQLKRSKEQLAKAKAIIRDYKIVVEGDHTTVCGVPEENRCINVLKLNEQAEQFLKELSE